VQRVVSTVESHLELTPSLVEFEMAYQARVAIDRIRFAIKNTEQFANHSPEAREAAFQLLDALDRLQSVERRFQGRSKSSIHDGTACVRLKLWREPNVSPFSEAVRADIDDTLWSRFSQISEMLQS
jgi:hypothetical protein